MSSKTTFTSESVCAGHPDKICDQISDAIVDQVLKNDPYGRAAIETLVTTNKMVIAGEVKVNTTIDYEKIARKEIKRLGYTYPECHFTDKASIDVLVHSQSNEIAVGVDNQGAGDQGMMFGFACNQTKNAMPLPIELAHQLTKKIDQVREEKKLPYLRPDGKSQVTVAYENGKPVAVNNIVIAVPHQETATQEKVKTELFSTVILPVLEEYGFSTTIDQVTLNGTGIWHIGGPHSDTGVTGRKIVVDTYGGYARVGGGCFSGKDPSKVDRSGAYAARFIAKNIVAHELAEVAEVRLAYCIGQPHPLMQEVETFGTAKKSASVIRNFASRLIDTNVQSIIETLNLRQPQYKKTASYGHFGRPEFEWEKIV